MDSNLQTACGHVYHVTLEERGHTMRQFRIMVAGSLLATMIFSQNWTLWAADPTTELRREEVRMETLLVPGLTEEVEILTDRWGIAHIYARNQHDLFFAQGFNAARDRLFQLEIWRRRVTGTLAEIQGPRAIDRDVGARLLQFRGNLDEEYRHYHPDGRAIVEAFVAGINAYIRKISMTPGQLPVEFELLQISPKEWTPEIVLARLGGIFMNIETEVLIARALPHMSADVLRKMLNLHPGKPDLAAAEGTQFPTIPATVLRYYQAAREAVDFMPEDIPDPKHRREQSDSIPVDDEPSSMLQSGTRDEGSNNWVISGSKTASGSPLMVNDPHRAVTVPSLRYWVHLVAPGWNVIGGGEPHLPGVSIGHNEDGAWGLTIFPTDAEDLYIYETNPDRPNQYLYQGQWEPMDVVQETIQVRGSGAISKELKFTRHGPILAEYPEKNLAFGLRAAWLDVGGVPYLASLRMDQARNWYEFRKACEYSRAPSENMVWADTEGNIGWQAVGVIPRRPNWNGLVPVPGDGSYEWDGYLPIRELPHLFQPQRGFVATANQANVPKEYSEQISYIWLEPFRHERIEEVLEQGKSFTIQDMAQLQRDEHSIPARLLVPFLATVELRSPLAKRAVKELLGWDFVLEKDSIPAGIYVAWQKELWTRFRDLFVPELLKDSFSSVVLAPLIASLREPGFVFGPDPGKARDLFVQQSFEAAVASLTSKLGTDLKNWRYGQVAYHHIVIQHVLGKAVNDELRAKLEIGPIPRGGDSFTVNNTGGEDMQTVGASFRLIADPSNWDSSLGANVPGQDGDPGGKHYKDMVQLWADGSYFPVVYSREKVIESTEVRTVLRVSP